MDLIGVVHCPEYLRDILKYLDKKYSQGIKSLMIELPENWPVISRNYGFSDGFFSEIAKKYEIADTKIIYGDRPVKKIEELFSEWEVIKGIFDKFMFNKRDRRMVEKILDYSPEVVIVGRLHADFMKKAFPEANYAALEEKINRGLFLAKPYKADEIIILEKEVIRYLPNQEFHQ